MSEGVKVRCRCGKVGTGYVPSLGDGTAFRLRKHTTPTGESCPWRYQTFFNTARNGGPGIIPDDARSPR